MDSADHTSTCKAQCTAQNVTRLSCKSQFSAVHSAWSDR